MQILKIVDHVNVIKFIDVVIDKTEDSLLICMVGLFLFISVMEYCKKGCLMKVKPGKQVEYYSESKARKYLRDILCGLSYCMVGFGY